jgi:hypothetical protein
MTHSLRPEATRRDFTILLVADSPPSPPRSDFGTPVARQEAIISLARATFAVGGSVAVPLDVDVAPLLGTLALDYLQPRAAELRGEPPVPRVTVMETQRSSPPARHLLAPLAARGAIRFVDSEGDEVVLEESMEAEIDQLNDVDRQRVTATMVRVVKPTFAVLIDPGRRVVEDVSVLRGAGVRTFTFGWEDVDEQTAALFNQLEVEDPTERLLVETTRSPWTEEEEEDDDTPRAGRDPVPPYAFLMQQLVAERLG